MDEWSFRQAQIVDTPHVATEVETNVGRLLMHRADPVTASVVEHGFWELHLVRLLEARLRPGMAFLDVGAHVGYFSLLASRLVGPTGRVVSVEANPLSVRLLRANLDRHGCDNVEVLPLAAWDSAGRVRLVHQPGEPVASWVAEEDEGESDRDVPAARLDDLLAGSFDVIKTDAEGSDHIALAGARRLLAACPLAVVEFWPRITMPQRSAEPRAIAESYLALGRELAVVSVMGDLEPVTVEELLALDGCVELALLRPRTRSG